MTNSTRSFCGNCGAVNRPQARFCASCGTTLRVSERGLKAPVSTSTGTLLSNHLLAQRYRILEVVGVGGMSAVYRAVDVLLGNRVIAIKEMSQAGLSTQDMIKASKAFEQEALLLADLFHPNLPRTYDYFTETGRWYLVMDFIEGKSLDHYLAEKASRVLPIEEVVDIGIHLCGVMDYLHTHQPPIIFRDLKPSNVMRTADSHLYLIDFGIARFFKPGQTKDTMAIGSVGYAAPEQYGKAQTTPRSDIYSLGAMLHYLLSGHEPHLTPFRFPSPQSLNPSIPKELDTLIMQMLEVDENKRPVSMASIKRDLQELLSQGTHSNSPVSPSLISQAQPKPTPVIKKGWQGARETARRMTQQLNNWLASEIPLVPPNDPTLPSTATSPKNFFISYNKADRAWAEWIAWQLEDAGYSAILPDWDFRPGLHFEQEMQKAAMKAECTIVVLSPSYLNARNTRDGTWTTVLRKGTVDGRRTLLPICVCECGPKLQHLLGSIIYIDLVGQDESVAREKLLAGIRNERWKPTTTPIYPGTQAVHSSNEQPPFPAPSDDPKEIHTRLIDTTTPKSDPFPTLALAPLESIEVFFSYSHVDTALRGELEKYLSNLKRQRVITGWHDGEIGPGNEWEDEIEIHLSQANIILLLVSQDFIASDYCFDVEMKKALERHDRREACVIPIILRPAHWKETPFGKLQALPKGGIPITMWQNVERQ